MKHMFRATKGKRIYPFVHVIDEIYAALSQD